MLKYINVINIIYSGTIARLKTAKLQVAFATKIISWYHNIWPATLNVEYLARPAELEQRAVGEDIGQVGAERVVDEVHPEVIARIQVDYMPGRHRQGMCWGKVGWGGGV